jgi:acyl carrier protein
MNNREDLIKKIVLSTLYKDIDDLDVHLMEDLNMDSLDSISFLFEVELEFDIQIPEKDIDKYNLFHLKSLYGYVGTKLSNIV